MNETVIVCKECMSADCGGDRGTLLIEITRERYDARPNVCPYCDRVNGCGCIENQETEMSEPTNQERADRVVDYVQDYWAKYEGDGTSISTTIQDFISDLLHYNKIAGGPGRRDVIWTGELLQSARDRFLEEAEIEDGGLP